MTEETIQAKITALEEQREQCKVMFQKFSGAIEAFEALLVEAKAESKATSGTVDIEKKEKVKK